MAENLKSENKTEEIENRIMLEQYLYTLSDEQQEILQLRYGQSYQINEICRDNRDDTLYCYVPNKNCTDTT